MSIPKGFIAITKSESSSEPTVQFRETYEECVDLMHEHFLSYDFEVIDGRPYDDGNSSDEDPEEGYDCFDNIVMHGDKVAGFSHCDGDGPEGEITENT